MVDPDELVELIIPIYLKHLDEATIDGVIVFAQPEVGKKLYEAQTANMQESILAGQRWGQELAEESLAELGD